MSKILPGRFTKAAIHAEAGELEVRLSTAGNWQVHVRSSKDREWRLACSGDLEAGAAVPQGFFGEEPVRIGKLVLDRGARRVCVDGAEVTLRTREYEILSLLARDPQRSSPSRSWRASCGAPRTKSSRRCRASTDFGRGSPAPASLLLAASLAQMLEVDDVLAAPRSLLHRHQVLVAAEANSAPEDFVLDRRGFESCVLEVGADELHDVEPPVLREEDEAAAQRERLRIARIGELLAPELLHSEDLCP
jgi:hypothetical protein